MIVSHKLIHVALFVITGVSLLKNSEFSTATIYTLITLLAVSLSTIEVLSERILGER